MRQLHFTSILILIVVVFYACSPKALPYKNGPVMSQKKHREKHSSQFFEFMEYKSVDVIRLQTLAQDQEH